MLCLIGDSFSEKNIIAVIALLQFHIFKTVLYTPIIIIITPTIT